MSGVIVGRRTVIIAWLNTIDPYFLKEEEEEGGGMLI